MLVHIVLAITHAVAHVSPAGPSGVNPESRETTAPSETERSEQAKALYAKQQYLESARAYEQLFAEFKAPKYLFNAAAAREAAGHDAHAYVLLRRYLETPGLSADEHERGESRMAPLRRRTTAIQLELSPSPRPPGVAVALKRPNMEPLTLEEAALQALERSGVLEVWAEPGEWTVEVNAPGFLTTSSELQASAGATKTISLSLLPATRTDVGKGRLTIKVERQRKLPSSFRLILQQGEARVEKIGEGLETPLELPLGHWSVTVQSDEFEAGPARVLVVRGLPQQVSLPLRRNLASKTKIGISVSAGVLGVVGGTLMAVGQVGYSNGLEELSKTKIDTNLGLFRRGSAVVGSSVGAGAAGLIMHRQPGVARPFYLCLGIGGASLLAGSLWTTLLSPKYEEHKVPSDRDGLMTVRVQDTIATLLLGIGVGLLSTSLLALVTRSRKRSHRARTLRNLP